MSKTYRAPGRIVEVLRDVSFTVAAGEMIAIVGASGAGKSTLLHILGGLDAADGGRIEIAGFEITNATVFQLARIRNRQVGFVFQGHHLLLDLTAAENVALPLLVRRQSRKSSLKLAGELLLEVGLSGFEQHRVTELSGGEQQRIAIARALVTNPQLVLADEPTGNLDAQAGERCAKLLLSLCRQRGTGVVIATHNRQLASSCDRVLMLADGTLQEQAR
ncbi:MAG: ABC transporter ATP-binding protein [Pyrinomonadaceae bacterium]